MGNYLSRRRIAPALQPSVKVMCRANNPLVDVAADRVYMAGGVSISSVSSYLAFPSLPQKRRFISVALSLRSPSAAVSRYPALCCSDFPHIAKQYAITKSTHVLSKKLSLALQVQKLSLTFSHASAEKSSCFTFKRKTYLVIF